MLLSRRKKPRNEHPLIFFIKIYKTSTSNFKSTKRFQNIGRLGRPIRNRSVGRYFCRLLTATNMLDIVSVKRIRALKPNRSGTSLEKLLSDCDVETHKKRTRWQLCVVNYGHFQNRIVKFTDSSYQQPKLFSPFAPILLKWTRIAGDLINNFL